MFTSTAQMQNKMDDSEKDMIQINISGTIFLVKTRTVQRFPNSRLAKLVNGPFPSESNKLFYFDQDAVLFGHILRCCRSGEIHVPTTVCPREFFKELEYWGIPVNDISSCCWPTFYKADDSVDLLNKLAEVTSQSDDFPPDKQILTWREKVWLFLDNPNFSPWAKVWFYTYLAVVGVSIIVYFLWMVPGLRVKPYLQNEKFWHNHTNNKIAVMMESDPHPVLFIIDLLCIFVFIIEFFLRFIVCPLKLKFFTVWYNIMNAILVVATLTAFILEMRKDMISSHSAGVFYYVVKNCYLFRLLLLLKLEKQFIGLKILILSVKESAKELFLLTFSLFMAMCIFGGLIFCAEIHTSMFPDIGVSLWWALVTITTVGYGEFYPTDVPGRIIGSLCAVCGIMLFALPIAVIVSKFSDFYGHRTYQRRHRELCRRKAS